MEIVTKSAKETKELGKKFAITLTSKAKYRGQKTEGLILALTGDLASGKTTFIQGLAQGLAIRKRVISPSFILLRGYQIPRSTIHRSLFTSFFHLDLYRLEKNLALEIKNLGIDEIWSKKENLVAIEWAEKIKNILPKNTIWLKFKNLGNNKRKISIGQFKFI